jgi:hypothetical protein
MLAASTAVPIPSICTTPVSALTVTTSGFELANEIDPALLDVGAVSVKSALVVVYREPGNVSAPSVVVEVEPDINPVTSTGEERFVVVPSPNWPCPL